MNIHAYMHTHIHKERENKMLTEGLWEGKNRQDPAELSECKPVRAGPGPDVKSQESQSRVQTAVINHHRFICLFS